MNNISFGKRIPISETRIYNKNTEKFEKATLYEIDGHDGESDLEELSDSGNWRYRHEMAANMLGKIYELSSYDELSDFKKNMLDNNRYYVLKTKDGKLAVICETHGIFNFSDVHYLERDKAKGYSLCGQAILASVVRQMLKKPDAQIVVSDPVEKAREFYTKSCGFEEKTPGSRGIEMYEDQMRDFVQRFEQTVQAPIVDIRR